MKQLIHLLSFRLSQGYRILSEIGFVLAVIAVFAIAGVALNALQNILEMKGIYSIPAGVFIFISIDFYRKDKSFLKSIFKSRFTLSRFLSIEYGLILSPIIIFQLIRQNYIYAISIILLTIILSLISTFVTKPLSSGFKKSIDTFPLTFFEIKFFVEQQKILVGLSILFLYLGVVHISFWVIGIAFLLGMIPEVFTFKEPLEMIKLHENFLSNKVLSYIFIYCAIIILPSILTCWFSGMSIWIFLYGIVAILLALIIAISIKYEHYYGLRSRIGSKTTSSLIIFLMLLPGFILITLFYAVMKFTKANNQIKNLCSS